MISLICGIPPKNGTSGLIDKTEIEYQTQKRNLRLPKAKGGRGIN